MMKNDTSSKQKFMPTCNLRVVKYVSPNSDVVGDVVDSLQQEFISTLDGTSEWREVPTVFTTDLPPLA